MSLSAEERVNASTLLPGSIIEQSAELRLEVENLINETEFKAKEEEHSQLLDQLAGKLQSLDLAEVAAKVNTWAVAAAKEKETTMNQGRNTGVEWEMLPENGLALTQ